MNPRVTIWLITLVTFLAIFVNLPKLSVDLKLPGTTIGINKILNLFPLKLGLDLQGGTQLTLQTQMDKIASPNRDTALEAARQVIERRVNLFGVSEAIVQSSKVGEERRILIELPGVKESSQAASLVGKTAQLDFRELPSDVQQEASKSGVPILALAKPTGLTGADLQPAGAKATYQGSKGGKSGPVVEIQFTPDGAQKFDEITKRNIGKPLVIFLDNDFVGAPIVQTEIIGGNAIITQTTVEEAKNLAALLNAGALPVPIKLLDQHFVGPTLGQESVNKSLTAGIIGILIVVCYMGVYYGFLGIIADLALIIYALLVLAIFRTGLFLLPPVTLTLAGIAGFILSVGMAVDANILIFERMKEEIRWGKNKLTALDLGFKRAWSSIWASNISSLITALILYAFGTSLVRGFAVTLAIGVLTSMFTAVVVTRTFLKLIIK